MKKYVSHFTTCAILTACLGSIHLIPGDTTMAAELKSGVKAPQFELPGSDGNNYKLADLNRQGLVVVVAWYPKAFTGG